MQMAIFKIIGGFVHLVIIHTQILDLGIGECHLSIPQVIGIQLLAKVIVSQHPAHNIYTKKHSSEYSKRMVCSGHCNKCWLVQPLIVINLFSFDIICFAKSG